MCQGLDPVKIAWSQWTLHNLSELGLLTRKKINRYIAKARPLNPELLILARAHHDSAVEHLSDPGASSVIMGEREMALAMLDMSGTPALSSTLASGS